MFYFLDAVSEPTLCRVCLAREQDPLLSRASEAMRELLTTGPAPLPAWSEDEVLPSGRGPAAPVSFYEAFTEIDTALRDLAPSNSLVGVARQLQLEAARRWKAGRGVEASEIVRQLRATLAELGLLVSFPGLASDAASLRPHALILASPTEIAEVRLAGRIDAWQTPTLRVRSAARRTGERS